MSDAPALTGVVFRRMTMKPGGSGRCQWLLERDWWLTEWLTDELRVRCVSISGCQKALDAVADVNK
jgi:hypothetical protein